MPGVRAAVCHDTYSAHQGVEHDDMNVLTLGARIIGAGAGASSWCARSSARTFSGDERHQRRLEQGAARSKRATRGEKEKIDG